MIKMMMMITIKQKVLYEDNTTKQSNIDEMNWLIILYDYTEVNII